MQLRQINAQDFHHALVQTVIQRIGSTRASIWYFNEYKDGLDCVALYDARTEEFSSGFTLYAEEYPEYFRAMVEGDTIVAVDAVRHPLTACFAETYFDPMDIKSLLDVSIIVKGEVVGVICCEHCEHRKVWSNEDISYLNTVSSALSLTKPLMQATEEVYA
jgi:GAF domain-containing protein